MKKAGCFLGILMFTLTLHGQTYFKEGFVIDQRGQRQEVLIKSQDWRKNPEQILVKVDPESKVKALSAAQLSEFEIDDVCRYERHRVMIDRSSDQLSQLGSDPHPFFHEEDILLQVLVSGKATLYQYADGKIEKYFFRVDSSEIKQLVYKRYRTLDDQLVENTNFKRQLLDNLESVEVRRRVLEGLDYSAKDLMEVFDEYNSHHVLGSTKYSGVRERNTVFRFSVKPGASMSTCSLPHIYLNDGGLDFGNSLGWMFAVELEMVLPFNNEKWSVILEPYLRQYESETSYRDRSALAKFTSIDVPLGMRYRSYIDEKSSVFLNASGAIGFPIDGVIEIEGSRDLSMSPRFFILAGLGYSYMGKYGIEVRYEFKNDLLKYSSISSEFSSVNLVVSYTF